MGGEVMKKHKMEKDLLKDFFFHLRENDFTITKKKFLNHMS